MAELLSPANWVAEPRMETPAANQPSHVGEIDSLRAFAMTAVLAQHCKILPFGWLGVWLFFVISGFVVTTSLLSRDAGGSATTLLTRFYARRAARIWPIYFGYVVAAFLVSAMLSGQAQWPAFASLMLFYNNFQSAFAHGTFKAFPVGHLWTISVEFQFYVVFGLAFAFLSRRALIALLIAFLLLSPLLRLAGSGCLQAAGYPRLNAAFAIYSFSLMHFDSFAAGALMALNRKWLNASRAGVLFLFGCAAMIAYAGAYAWVNRSHGAAGLAMLRNIVSGILFGDLRQVWLYSAVAALSAGVLAITLTGAAPWAPITRNAFVQTVGRISYGGYVYHVMFVEGIGALMGLAASPGGGMAHKLALGAVRFALALPATVALASLSYRFIERPIIVRANQLLARTV